MTFIVMKVGKCSCTKFVIKMVIRVWLLAIQIYGDTVLQLVVGVEMNLVLCYLLGLCEKSLVCTRLCEALILVKLESKHHILEWRANFEVTILPGLMLQDVIELRVDA